MKLHLIFLLVLVALSFLGCASPQDKAYGAQEDIHKERLKLVENYKNCLEEAAGDSLRTEACDQYLKAAEALK